MADTHVTITGNLTDAPDLRFTPNGNPVANFRLAVTSPHQGRRHLARRRHQLLPRRRLAAAG
jgi:single-stranded DNA-binding protein